MLASLFFSIFELRRVCLAARVDEHDESRADLAGQLVDDYAQSLVLDQGPFEDPAGQTADDYAQPLIVYPEPFDRPGWSTRKHKQRGEPEEECSPNVSHGHELMLDWALDSQMPFADDEPMSYDLPMMQSDSDRAVAEHLRVRLDEVLGGEP
mmetsp:Transcript_146216/g.371159  ORF Transcript_146216/g.371159 Transcript_146216/m.371159 type:complete len:152 (+) Transcript_146216:108-563(+)